MLYIAFSIDNNYAKYFAVTVASILKNAKIDDEFTFYIFHNDDIDKDNIQKISMLSSIHRCHFFWITVSFGENIKSIKLSRHVSIATILRLCIASELYFLEKVLFLDADLITRTDLNNLWNTNIEGYYIACREESESFVSPEYRKTIEIYSGKYYNTGVMLCNLKKWREDDIEKKFYENMNKYSDKCLFFDQDILNITLQEKILPLETKWNACVSLGQVDSQTNIIHWVGSLKPWKGTHFLFSHEYFYYASLTNFFYEIYTEANDEYFSLHRQIKKIYSLLYNSQGINILKDFEVRINKIEQLLLLLKT